MAVAKLIVFTLAAICPSLVFSAPTTGTVTGKVHQIKIRGNGDIQARFQQDLADPMECGEKRWVMIETERLDLKQPALSLLMMAKSQDLTIRSYITGCDYSYGASYQVAEVLTIE
ncbi:hypothetical protein [Microbulbifer agarilyticus]